MQKEKEIGTHHSSRSSSAELLVLLLFLAWTSLDCLFTSLPILPVSHSSRVNMRSNVNLQMSDPRRISPQTTSSSGYHSDLSSATSTNQSPQSIHEILPLTVEESPSLSSSSHSQHKATSSADTSFHDRPANTKNLSRLSSFLRRQYERARSKLAPMTSTLSSHQQQKLLSTQPSKPTVVTTCSKGTSTTPVSHLSEDNYTFPSKPQQQHSSCNQKAFQPHYLSSVYKQSSYAEPVSTKRISHPLLRQTRLVHRSRHAFFLFSRFILSMFIPSSIILSKCLPMRRKTMLLCTSVTLNRRRSARPPTRPRTILSHTFPIGNRWRPAPLITTRGTPLLTIIAVTSTIPSSRRHDKITIRIDTPIIAITSLSARTMLHWAISAVRRIVHLSPLDTSRSRQLHVRSIRSMNKSRPPMIHAIWKWPSTFLRPRTGVIRTISISMRTI